jgi:N-acetylmuramoyl-L-alanine amidase
MNTSRWLQVAVLATASSFTVGALSPTTAATFDSTDVNPNNFIAIAAPFGNNQHQLLIIEQISNRQACWSESGSNPVNVEPLLLKFDFTGICGRSTDSNGYSIRMNGEDLGLEYLLRIVERDGELVLVGSHRTNRQAPDIEIGTTKGLSDGFEKIFLNPGWRFTRRTYNRKALGHIYLTNDSAAPVAQESNTRPQPLPATSQPLPTPERELIFTKPQVVPTVPEGEIPATRPQTRTSPSTPERQIPVFVVPTN